MKIYHNLGNEEINPVDFAKYLLINHLKIKSGRINSTKILERKFFSNKGNALDGWIECENGFNIGLNIGGNPIGTGYKNYISFLDEIGCEKIGNLFIINSIIDKPIFYLVRGDNVRGYLTKQSIDEFLRL
jgi:hypothetical protein